MSVALVHIAVNGTDLLCPWIVWKTEFLLNLQQLDLNNGALKPGTWSLGLVVFKDSNWNSPQSAEWQTCGDSKSRFFLMILFLWNCLILYMSDWSVHFFIWKCTSNTENHIQYHQEVRVQEWLHVILLFLRKGQTSYLGHLPLTLNSNCNFLSIILEKVTVKKLKWRVP